jgi:hypothetical protein
MLIRLCAAISLGLAVLVSIPSGHGEATAQAPPREDVDFFQKQVQPLLAARCYQCHGDLAKPKGKLRLTSRAFVLNGGESGPAAVAGKPDQSLLIQAVSYADALKMPPKGKLPAGEIDILNRWVQMGLPWPESNTKSVEKANEPEYQITSEQRSFWSFQPVKSYIPPEVKGISWPHSGIDRFILSKLEKNHLHPAQLADKRTLIRRATFDLIGLPPTTEEVENFLQDNSENAYARVVDRLLASPHYGEHWGRHWLDLVRYTDSFDARILNGPGSEMDITEAWRYRDWVVSAFNRDLPYDQFIIDQIAGDIIAARQPSSSSPDQIVATTMLAIGNWGGGDADKEKLLTDIVDDQIDVVGRSIMGLTVACARCHDHKFDPIPTADYYSLAGIFFSTHILPNVGPKTNGPPMLRIPLTTPEELNRRSRYAAQVTELENQLQARIRETYQEFARAMLPQTGHYIAAAWEFSHPSKALVRVSLTEYAARNGLYEFALRRWLEALGLGDYGDGGYRLMATPVRDVLGTAGVHAWKGPPDCPSLTVNTTDKEVALLTFRLPPRSVSVHPGPTNGVVVGWKSPIDGMVRISGRVVDADPAGGDGIAWIIDHRTHAGRHELASGDFPNGGRQVFDKGRDASRLKSVFVKTGEQIQLLVLPKANHTCDTTVVEFSISKEDGLATWNLTQDILSNPHQGNPHGDGLGNSSVWFFYDMADSTRAKQPAKASMLLGFSLTGKSRQEVEKEAFDFQKTFQRVDGRSPFYLTEVEQEKFLPAEARRRLADVRAELAELKKNAPGPLHFSNGAQEGGVPESPQSGIHDVRIHIRGSYTRLGETVPRRFPRILGGDRQAPIRDGSGRLELARWLVSPDHPLTSRVMVNRIWQYHFGQGIVRTPSNFGKQGERPTHQELLDFLAKTFVESGWSIKAMHRLIMLAAAYQQSSEPPPETRQADPDNLLFGHMNRHRLEAESLRDNLLAVAGRLNRTMGGKATRDFNSSRRTLYQLSVRSDRSGFGPLFDMADSTTPEATRTVSTVAPQALFLLNHPFVLQQKAALARRILQDPKAKNNSKRIENIYAVLYGRPPTKEESQIGLEFLARLGNGDQAWNAYCEVLLCANEFVYVD